MKIDDFMTRAPRTVQKTTTVKAAYELMKSANFRHLPIVHNNTPVGVVSDRDLKAVMAFPQAEKSPVETIMTTNPHKVKRGTALTEVTEVMAKNKLGSVIIVDDFDSIVGIFTVTDAVKLLHQLLTKGVAMPPKSAAG